MARTDSALPSDTTEEQINGRGVTRRRYDSSDGLTLIETYVVEGMGHSWPGGQPQGSFTDPEGPDASALMVAFFLNHSMVDISGGLPRWEPARPAPVAPPPAAERPVREPPPPPPLRFTPPRPEEQPGALKRMGGLLKHLWRRVREK
jgi:hypothetical protein